MGHGASTSVQTASSATASPPTGARASRRRRGRYHVYVALACPWSHRAVIVRTLKGLEDAISISYAHPFRDERGWAFPGGRYIDTCNGFAFLEEAYERSRPGYDDRVSVLSCGTARRSASSPTSPATSSGCSTASSSARDRRRRPLPGRARRRDRRAERLDLRPAQQRRLPTGFASSQEAYERAFGQVQQALERPEILLGERRYLAGDRITRPTGASPHPGPVRRRLPHALPRQRPPHLRPSQPLGLRPRALPAPGDRRHRGGTQIREHYYTTHDSLNPKHLVPVGPRLDWQAPPRRGGCASQVRPLGARRPEQGRRASWSA